MVYFSASINLPGHKFPAIGKAETPAELGWLVNRGTTPSEQRASDPLFRIGCHDLYDSLTTGRTTVIGPVVISPITVDHYERAR